MTFWDLSKVESGRVELESIDFDLAEVLEKNPEMLAMRAHEKGLELAWHIAPNVPAGLTGDPVRLRQVVINLLENTIKFTEKGEVVLNVDRDLRSAEAGSLCFKISDTGIGIPEEKRVNGF